MIRDSTCLMSRRVEVVAPEEAASFSRAAVSSVAEVPAAATTIPARRRSSGRWPRPAVEVVAAMGAVPAVGEEVTGSRSTSTWTRAFSSSRLYCWCQ